MQNISTIYNKELRSYFNSPVAYIVIIVFLAITGYFFTNGVLSNNAATLRPMFDIVPFIFLFFIPAITMRTFSEEKKQGTIELLLTKPIEDMDLVLGKFLSSLALTAIALLPTLIYFIIIMMYSAGKVDYGSVIGGYLGLVFLAGVYISIGLFFSSITENQVVAFIVSFLVVFALFMMGKVLMQYSPILVSIFEYVSTDYHFTNISRGVIDTRDIIYYASMIFFWVYLTKVSIESRKW